MVVAPVQEPKISIEADLAPRYQVVLLDDDDHTYDYVVEMLGVIFGMDIPTAFHRAQEVDRSGRVIVYTGPLEIAELKQEQIHTFGIDWRLSRCKGSMTAVLEPMD